MLASMSAHPPLPLAPLCERAQTPEVCQSSRSLLNRCETMGLGSAALQAACTGEAWEAHSACIKGLLSGSPDLCEDLANRIASIASLELLPSARGILGHACDRQLSQLKLGDEGGSSDAWCRSIQSHLVDSLVAVNLVAGGRSGII